MSLILTGLAFTYTLNFKKQSSIENPTEVEPRKLESFTKPSQYKLLKKTNLFFRKQTEQNSFAPSPVI